MQFQYQMTNRTQCMLSQKPYYFEQLICPICFDILQDPIIEVKNQHYFCKKCIKSIHCPLCREDVEFQQSEFLNSLLSLIECNCVYSNCNWSGNFQLLQSHLQQCAIHQGNLTKDLTTNIQIMKIIIQQAIEPHLIEEHKEIFESIINNWNFLQNDSRDWRWWWWLSNPWWENRCIYCELLGLHFDEIICQYDVIRRQILEEIKKE